MIFWQSQKRLPAFEVLMTTIQSIVLGGHTLIALLIIILVLLQRGKGADAGAAFGSGASGTVFGARGSTNFFSRATAVMATIFFISSLALAYLSTQQVGGAPDSLLEDAAPLPEQPATEEAPESAADPDALPEFGDAEGAVLEPTGEDMPVVDELPESLAPADELPDLDVSPEEALEEVTEELPEDDVQE